MTKAEQIISAKKANPDASLARLAEKFDCTRQYASQVWKQYTGESRLITPKLINKVKRHLEYFSFMSVEERARRLNVSQYLLRIVYSHIGYTKPKKKAEFGDYVKSEITISMKFDTSTKWQIYQNAAFEKPITRTFFDKCWRELDKTALFDVQKKRKEMDRIIRACKKGIYKSQRNFFFKYHDPEWQKYDFMSFFDDVYWSIFGDHTRESYDIAEHHAHGFKRAKAREEALAQGTNAFGFSSTRGNERLFGG